MNNNQMTGGGIVEFPDVAEAIIDNVKLVVDKTFSRYYIIARQCEHETNSEGITTTWVNLPQIIVDKYNVESYMPREMRAYVDYNENDIKDCETKLQTLRRILYERAVEAIRSVH
jgi:hypothetical protein